MKSTSALSLFACISSVVAESWTISSLSTSMRGDDANSFYSIGLQVRSPSGCGFYDAYCYAQWPVADNEPTDQWIECVHNSTNQYQDPTGSTAFQIYPDFSYTGDFSIRFQQNYTTCGECLETANQDTLFTVPSGPSTFTCDADKCHTFANFTGFEVPISSSTSLNCSVPVELSFPVLERTVFGDNIFVVGNISQLGNWNPYEAAGLSASEYTDANNLWTGAYVIDSRGQFINNVIVDSGTSFEWKYIEWTKNGTLIWECGENRVFTTINDNTNKAAVGSNPDIFRCGNQ